VLSDFIVKGSEKLRLVKTRSAVVTPLAEVFPFSGVLVNDEA
jgi:hypothetical protein